MSSVVNDLRENGGDQSSYTLKDLGAKSSTLVDEEERRENQSWIEFYVSQGRKCIL